MAGQYGTPKKTGGSKRSLAQRKADNKNVKHGAVRAGAKGKQMRQYNSKTGRWELIKSSYGAPRMAGKKPAAKKIGTTRVSPSARGEGSNRTLTKRPVEFARGIGVQHGRTSAQKSKSLREAKNVRAYDRSPRGQKKNTEGILNLATLAAGGVAGAGARLGGAAAARAAAPRVTTTVIRKPTGRPAITGRKPKALPPGKKK